MGLCDERPRLRGAARRLRRADFLAQPVHPGEAFGQRVQLGDLSHAAVENGIASRGGDRRIDEIGPLPRGRNRILLCVLRENVKTAMRRYGEGKYRPP